MKQLLLSSICFCLFFILGSVNMTPVHFCVNHVMEMQKCVLSSISHFPTVWVVCWIVTNSWLGVLPEGTAPNQCQHIHWGGLQSPPNYVFNTQTVICPAGTLSNTFYFPAAFHKYCCPDALQDMVGFFPLTGHNGWSLHFPSMKKRVWLSAVMLDVLYLSWGPGDIALTLAPWLCNTHWEIHT